MLKPIMTACHLHSLQEALYSAPRCAHFSECGGCLRQHVSYKAQLALKQVYLEKLYEGMPLRPITACLDPWHYRNKMEFTFSQDCEGKRFLGLFKKRGRVVDLAECHLVSAWFITLLDAVRAWWIESGLTAYRMNDTGTLRTLIVREGKRTGDKLIMLTVSGNPHFAMGREQMQSFVQAVSAILGTERVSIYVRVQQICKGRQTQFFEMHLSGPDHLLEKCTVGGKEFTFKISPSSFFQPNTQMAEVLYNEALGLIRQPVDHLMDLYAGIGTLGLVCARMAKQVTCIELNPYSVYDAESNKELNGIDHCTMVCGDVGKIVKERIEAKECPLPECILIDPPRCGLDKLAMQIIQRIKPKEIIYIACNPQTQVENIHFLMQEDYSVDHVQPVDQFPHTPHIEMVVHLSIKE